MQVLESIADRLKGMVRDAMTDDLPLVQATTSVAEVADRMADKSLRRVVVVDEHQHVIGVVSQRDVVRHYLAAADASHDQGDASPGLVEVQTLISRSKPVTVTPEIPLIKAALALATNKIGCLPVVGPRQEAVGLLTTADILHQITGHALEFEAAFQFYAPSAVVRTKLPAYIRKSNGELVIPLVCLDNRESLTDFVLLGYDPPSGRILIKFVPEANESQGSLRLKRDDEALVIPAGGFVTHFDLARKKTTAYDVSDHKDTKYLILTPRQSV